MALIRTIETDDDPNPVRISVTYTQAPDTDQVLITAITITSPSGVIGPHLSMLEKWFGLPLPAPAATNGARPRPIKASAIVAPLPDTVPAAAIKPPSASTKATSARKAPATKGRKPRVPLPPGATTATPPEDLVEVFNLCDESPTKIAQHYGRQAGFDRMININVVYKWLYRARQAGVLPPASPARGRKLPGRTAATHHSSSNSKDG